MIQKYYQIFFIVTLSLIFFGCEEDTYREIEIEVVSTSTIEKWVLFGQTDWRWSRIAIVEYCAKNTGTKNINGWEVYFNVKLIDSPQMNVHESVYYFLSPRETSKIRTLECVIPEYYDDAYSASLKHVETW